MQYKINLIFLIFIFLVSCNKTEKAKNYNCGQIKWTVAPWNKAGQKFYERLGATENNEWLNYEWKI